MCIGCYKDEGECYDIGCFCVSCAYKYHTNSLQCRICQSKRAQYVGHSRAGHNALCVDCLREEFYEYIEYDEITHFVNEDSDEHLYEFLYVMNTNYFYYEFREVLEEKREKKIKIRCILDELEEVSWHPDNIVHMVENGHFSECMKVEGEGVVFSV